MKIHAELKSGEQLPRAFTAILAPSLRNRRIDQIRGISIVLVLLHHFNIAYHLPDTMLGAVLTPGGVRAIVRNGNYGVTMFFVVSGFLITLNAQKRWGSLSQISIRGFYVLRIARIMPCLLLLLFIVDALALSGLSIFGSHIPHTGLPVSALLVNAAALTFWMNVLIAHDGWVNYALGVLWSLSVEEVFYLTFPVICLVLRRQQFLVLFWLAIIAIGPLYRMTHQADESGFLFAYFASFDSIAIGCCSALLAVDRKLTNSIQLKPSHIRLLQIATLSGMAFLYLYRSIHATNILGVSLMALGTATLLLASGTQRGGPSASRNRLLVIIGWLGQLSYELYLFHLIVLGLLRTVLPPQTVFGNARLLLLLVFLALSTAASAAIARLYSEPLNRLIRQRLSAEPDATTR